MEEGLPPEVSQTYRSIIASLGESFSFDALKLLTELLRGKPLRIEEDGMPVAMTGYCIALADVDLICTRWGMDAILSRSACLHEIAHLLLGHMPPRSSGAQTPGYDEFRRRRELSGVVFRSLAGAYSTPQEHQAETLATLLNLAVSQHERMGPPLARRLHL